MCYCFRNLMEIWKDIGNMERNGVVSQVICDAGGVLENSHFFVTNVCQTILLAKQN